MRNFPTKVDGVSTEPADEYNNLTSELKTTVTSFGEALNGSSVEQLTEAMSNYAGAGDFYQDSGSVNTYVLSKIGSKSTPTAYYDGLRIRFVAGNTNTGPSTVNLATLGVKSIKTNNGSSELSSGDINAGDHVDLVYVLSSDYFLLTINRSHSQLYNNYIDGFKLERGSVDPDHEITMNHGLCVDSKNSVIMDLQSAITKKSNAPWAEGDSNGGFPTGITLTADTWYHFFSIRKNDGTLDAGFDSSITATNLLIDATSYLWYRRVGSIYVDSSLNIKDFIQIGNYFYWVTPVLDIDVALSSTTAQTAIIFTPKDIRTMAFFNLFLDVSTGGVTYIYISPIDTADLSPSQTVAPLSFAASNGINKSNEGQAFVMTDTLSQIRYRASGQVVPNPAFRLSTLGWIDFRGKNYLG